MSVGVRKAARGPRIRRSSASTTKVYGRLRAIRTSAVIKRAFLDRAGELAIHRQKSLALIYPNCAGLANARPRPLHAVRHIFSLPRLKMVFAMFGLRSSFTAL